MTGTGSVHSPMRGFTLIELVVVIAITGAIATSVAMLIQRPIESYQAQGRRATLVDNADLALGLIARELHGALPNSVRIGCGGRCLEFLRTFSGGRYRARLEDDPLSLSFDPGDADERFEVLGFLNNSSQIVTGSGDACRQATASCVVIYNTGTTGADAYNMDNAATVTAVDSGPPITIDFDNSGFSSGQPAFPNASPEQRFFLVDTPVTYLCDPVQGTVRRYQGYTIRAAQTAVDTHAELIGQSNPAEHALLVDRVSDCRFDYDPGTPTRNALVTLRLQVAEGSERVTLLVQSHVSNSP